MKTQMYRFLYSYQNTPHTTTRVTPSSLVFKKLPNTKFSLLKPSFGETQRRCQDSSSETKRNFEPEDTVLILNTRNATESRWREGTVMQCLGPVSYVVRCGEQNRHVHSDHMRLLRCSSTSEADLAVVRSSSVFDTPIVASNCTSIRSPTGVESFSCSDPTDVVLDVPISSMPTSCTPSASSSPTLDVTESVRRSTRLCKAPSRLIKDI